MITAGIDCGAKNTKSVIIKDGRLVGKGKVLTGFDPQKALAQSLAMALKNAGISRQEIHKIVGTGCGKIAVKIADGAIKEIEAISKGAHYFFPNARTVIDVGAEEGRAAKIDEKGNPVDFEINEQCAAGAGAFVEAMARALEVTIEEMGPLCLQSDREIPINAQCVVFAESEVVGLIHAQTDKRDICKAIHDSMASRIGSLIRRIGVNEDVVLIGGVGYNVGFRAAIQRELKVQKIYIPDAPEYGAAVGAAIAAAEES